MLRNRRRILAALLALALLSGLTACGKEDEVKPYNGIVYVPEELSFQWGLQSVLSGCVVGETVYLAGYGDSGEVQLQRLPASGGEAEPLPNYQPTRAEDRAYSLGTRMWAGTGGTLWLRETVHVKNFNEAGGFTGSEDLLVLRQLDADGRELSCFEADRKELEGQMGLGSVYDLVMDGDGDVFVKAEKGIALLDRTGGIRFTLEMARDYGDPALLSDGRVGFTDRERGEGLLSLLRTVDKEAGDWGESFPLSIVDTATVYGGDENALFYYKLGDTLWAWREDPGEEGTEESAGGGEELMSFLDAGIDAYAVRFPAFLPDGRLAVMCVQVREVGSTASLNVLAPTEASALPDKKVLTYAAFYLGSRERAAILDFNRTSEEYMISVTDYSQYGSLTDTSGGLTRLTTEIGAGHIPDILAVWNMPIARWGAKGLLEDLWPYIDNDPELGREDLMIRVLEAAEIDGKLYEISDSFRFSTLTGAKSVVGDRFTWTPEDMWEALEKMPDGCIPLRDGSKTEVLLSLMQMDWSRFVDWEKGTCRFDSEEFREVLDFCNSFPDTSGQIGVEDEQLRLLDKQQMLMNWHIVSLDSLQEYSFLLGDEISFVGYPNPWGEVGSSFYLDSGLAMSSACKYKDAAWSFMRRLLMPHQEIDGLTFFSFPVNKADFEAEMKRQTKPLSLDSDGEEVTFTIPVYAGDVELEREHRASSQSDLDLVMALYEQVDTVVRRDDALAEIITDVAGAYFAGDKTMDETVELIQNRARLYVSEQS